MGKRKRELKGAENEKKKKKKMNRYVRNKWSNNFLACGYQLNYDPKFSLYNV